MKTTTKRSATTRAGLMAILMLAASYIAGTASLHAQGRSLQTPPANIQLRDSFDTPPADAQTLSIVAAAQAFLASLDPDQRRAAVYDFADNTQRANWSNFPEGAVKRGGVMLGDLSDAQKTALDALLATVLSEDGITNIDWQLAAEATLGTGGRVQFGPQYYYTSFLNEPVIDAPWMLQFGGHHLAINVTINGPDISFSPMLTGGEPLNITYGGEQLYITARETAAALAFMGGLDADQKAVAIRGTRPINLVLGPGEFGTTIAPEGLKASALNAAQKAQLLALVSTRLGHINADDYAAKMARITADLDETWFGWWGPEDTPGAAYYRVTGPSVVIEYSPQGRGQDVTNHAHNMYRDPENDYGIQWIAQ